MKTKTKLLAYFGFVMLALCLMSNADKTYAAHDIHVSTGGPQEVTVQGNRESAVVSSDSINVTTTCRSGYNLVISTSVNDNNLYLDGDATKNTAGTYFSPSDGIAPLSSAANTWGYYYDGENVPTTSSIFSAVPTLGNGAVIRSPLETPSETDINDSFNVYYGVSASDTIDSGIYKMIPDTNDNGNSGSIVYQATIADACMRYTINFNPTDTYSGSDVTGTGTMPSQSVYEGTTVTLDSNAFTAPEGYTFIGWNTAQDGSGTMYADGASITDLAPAGGSINLYAMWSNCPAGSICYESNGENVTGTMGNQTTDDGGNDLAENSVVTLHASNYSKEGYGFAGWSNVSNYDTNENAKFYGPNETITVQNDISVRGLSMHAIWIASEGSLQDSNKVAELCGTGEGSLTQAPTDGTANLSSVSALTDQRDNQTYTIAKLADGKCWMVENLRLEHQYTTGNNQTDPTVTNESLSQGYNPSFIGLAEPESDLSISTTANSLYSIDGSTAKTISGTDQGYRFPRYSNGNTANRATDADGTSNTFSYGNYYTWPAIIADTTEYSSGDHNTTSICPRGWHLPTGGASGEFHALNNDANAGSTSGSTGFRNYPANFLFSGNLSSSSANFRGSYGFYWSSTDYSAYLSFNLSIYDIYVNPATNGGNKYYGLPARCVLD